MIDTKTNGPVTKQARNTGVNKVGFYVKSVAEYVEAGGFATISFAVIGKKAGLLDDKTSKKIGLTGLGMTCVSIIPDIHDNLKGGTGAKIADSMINLLTKKGAKHD